MVFYVWVQRLLGIAKALVHPFLLSLHFLRLFFHSSCHNLHIDRTRELWLDTYMEKYWSGLNNLEKSLSRLNRSLHRSINRVFCPKCHKYGFWTTRKAGKKYYPKYATTDAILLDLYQNIIKMHPDDPYYQGFKSSIRHIRKTFKGSRYRGDEKKELFDREACYHKLYRYKYRYIGHYDPEKYRQQMQDFKSGKRKSRPNGRKWCGPFKLEHQV